MTEAAGPTVLGVDVFLVATILAAVATFAMLVALYAATTVRDPMAKRVKALNDRREQLKAGITASARRPRRALTQKNETTDRMRSLLKSLNTLQDDQLQRAQQRLAQAGIRSKDLAVAVIFGRLVLPIVIGGGLAIAVYGFGFLSDYTAFKKFMIVGGTLILSYKAPDLDVSNKV